VEKRAFAFECGFKMRASLLWAASRRSWTSTSNAARVAGLGRIYFCGGEETRVFRASA